MLNVASHPRTDLAVALLFAACGLALTSCAAPDDGVESAATVFEGARLIVGDGSVIEDAVFVVEDDRVTQVGAASEVETPRGAARVDLAGKDRHPRLRQCPRPSGHERELRTSQLRHMAYYGAGVVISLGHDEGEVPFAMRAETVPDAARSLSAGRGITMPEPGRSEVPFWVTNEEEAAPRSGSSPARRSTS